MALPATTLGKSTVSPELESTEIQEQDAYPKGTTLMETGKGSKGQCSRSSSRAKAKAKMLWLRFLRQQCLGQDMDRLP